MFSLYIEHAFLLSADLVFQINVFKKILSAMPSECAIAILDPKQAPYNKNIRHGHWSKLFGTLMVTDPEQILEKVNFEENKQMTKKHF